MRFLPHTVTNVEHVQVFFLLPPFISLSLLFFFPFYFFLYFVLLYFFLSLFSSFFLSLFSILFMILVIISFLFLSFFYVPFCLFPSFFACSFFFLVITSLFIYFTVITCHITAFTRLVYEYEKQKSGYTKINVPSWCDRVLWRSFPNAHIKQV